MRAKGKASVRIADILNRMQVEEPVNSNDVKFTCYTLSVIVFSGLAIYIVPNAFVSFSHYSK